MLTNSIAARTLRAALATGGDFAELFCQDRTSQSITLRDGRVESALTRRIHGAGVRVFRGLRCVYAHICDTSAEGLLRAAQRAADALGSSSGNVLGSSSGNALGSSASDALGGSFGNVLGTAGDVLGRAGDAVGRAGSAVNAAGNVGVELIGSRAANIHPIQQLPLDVPAARKVALLKSACAAEMDASPRIAHAQAGLSCSQEEVQIFNSEGLAVGDERIRTMLRLSAVASDGAQMQTGGASLGALMGWELFRGQVDPEEAARDAARRAATMLSARPCPAGRMPVVLEGGFGGVIFHEACGHSLEATSVALGNSEFCGKLGQRIAAPCVTAVDDGTIPNAWGSLNIDDEGLPTTKLVLIENGVLKNYMIDRHNARRMNLPPTGSGRRQDYTFAPTSRMRNTYIAAGHDDEEEMISGVDFGLYAKKLGGGSVNPATGEFNFAVSEGYLIRDGKIAEPVRGATLIGRGSEVLRRIDRVGPRMWMQPGMCGSVSGSVPTNVGQPRIRISELTVGGRAE